MIYRMRKIVSYTDELTLPTCMYRLKNINDDGNIFEETEPNLRITEQVTNFVKSLPSDKMTELLKRQDNLLHQLDLLHERVKSLGLLCKNQPARVTIMAQKKPQILVPEEVIVNVSPDNLPFFFMILAKSLHDDITLSYHVHSTVTTASINKIEEFMKSIHSEKFVGSTKVKLIFKEVSANTEMKWSSTGIPVVGEVNILRFLSFSFPDVIPYDESWEEDSLLDECYLLQRTQQHDASLQRLFSSYKGGWILGDSFSIIDVAAFSVIKQLEGKTSKLFRFTPKQWFDEVNQYLK